MTTTRKTTVGKKRVPANGPTQPRISAARMKEAEALTLRKQGKGLEEIAKTVGYANASGAHKAITRALGRVGTQAVDEMRALEGQRLDGLQDALWSKAMLGDEKAAAGVIRVMVRRARLFGLDMPSKREVTFRDEIRAMTDRIAEELGMDADAAIAEAERILGSQD